MAASTVRFVVSFAINDGAFAVFERIARTMSAETQKEAGTLAYEWSLSADRGRGRLFEAYADGGAALVHLKGPVVQELVPKLLEAGSVTGFEVFGDPGPEAAAILAAMGAEIFSTWQGFSR